MELQAPHCAPYGEGGDIVGARRLRWSFRLITFALVFTTFSLWYSERNMRYDLKEIQYRNALTLHPAAARPILRNIVAVEEREKGEITPKYLLALAAVEEEDKIIPAYERAFQLSPSDTNLLINYGVQLFIAGQYLDARDRFREAGIQAPDNALPRYLEAAALAASSMEEGKDPLESGALVDALALIERTNNRNTPIIFPKPLWHPTLPTDINWYNMESRKIVNHCCAPLYKFESIMIPRALNEMEAGRIQNWDAWLETLQHMGQRLLSTPDGNPDETGIVRAQAGLQFQRSAIRLRMRLREMNTSPADDTLAAKVRGIEEAIKKIQEFETRRELQVSGHNLALKRPVFLLFQVMALVTLAYLVAYVLSFLLHKLARKPYAKFDDSAWAVRHSPWILGLMLASCVGFGAVLFALGEIARLIALDTETLGADHVLSLGATMGLGLVMVVSAIFLGYLYAAFKLPSAQKVLDAACQNRELAEADKQKLRRNIKKARRLASALLLRRYAGIHWALTLLTICTWFLVFRMVYNAYPTEVALLTIGLREQEIALLHELQRALP